MPDINPETLIGWYSWSDAINSLLSRIPKCWLFALAGWEQH